MSPDLPREVLLADILQGKPFCEFCTPLKVTNGWAVVHHDDVAWLTKLTKKGKPQAWSLVGSSGYVCCGGFERHGQKMHRAVMRATSGAPRVDHRNGLKHHNCRCNLRLCDDTVHNGKSKALAKPQVGQSGWRADVAIGAAGRVGVRAPTEDEIKRVINYIARYSGRTEHYHPVDPLFPVDTAYADSCIARAEVRLKERARILEQARAIDDTGRYVVKVKDAFDKNVLRDVIVDKRGKFLLSMAEAGSWRVMTMGGVRGYNGIFSGQYLHGLVFGQSCQRVSVDHINNNPLDNRSTNLRASTNRTNALNCKDRRAPGWRGTAWRATSKRWQALFYCTGKFTGGGYFMTREQAALAYDAYQHWMGLVEDNTEFRKFNYPKRKPVIAVTADMTFEEVRAALYAWRGPFDSSKVVHEEFVAPSGKTKC